MNFATVLQALIPMMEPILLSEWSSAGLPYFQGLAAKLALGKGQEEALAACAFLDALAKIELARKP